MFYPISEIDKIKIENKSLRSAPAYGFLSGGIIGLVIGVIKCNPGPLGCLGAVQESAIGAGIGLLGGLIMKYAFRWDNYIINGDHKKWTENKIKLKKKDLIF